MSDGRFTPSMTIQMKATFTFFCFHERGNSFTAGQPLKSFYVILIKLAFPVTLAFGRLNGQVFTGSEITGSSENGRELKVQTNTLRVDTDKSRVD